MQVNLHNQIPVKFENILPSVKEVIKPEELIDKVPIKQYLEKAEEINRLNLGNPTEALQDITLITKVDDDNVKAIGLGCLTGVHTFNGNYRKAITSITQALNLKLEDEVYAYILTEYANLLRQLKRTEEALAVLDQAAQITENEKLKWRIITYQGYCLRYSDKKRSLDLLTQATRYYLDQKEHVRYVTILRHIGLIHLQYDNFKLAKKYITEAETLAKRYTFSSTYRDVLNDQGWICIREKEYKQAKNIFNQLLEMDKDPYLESLVIQNLAYIEFEKNNYSKAIEYHKQSLEITAKYEIYEMLFEDYYKLGLCYERIGKYKEAEQYYAAGYAKLQSERKQLGIILLNGYRSNLIDNYMRFLAEKPTIEHVGKYGKTFAFTEGKTYTEILGIFQKHLLSLHRVRNKTVRQLCDKLNISLRLYFVYQNRFGIKKSDIEIDKIENQHFINYLYSMLPMDWRSAIKQFDTDLYGYLLKKYNYNKTKIAEILDVSILTAIKKTIDIDQDQKA